MAIIPLVRCRTMKEAVAFYTGVLDFTLVGTWPAAGDPSFSILKRDGDELNLSSHEGDGVFGQRVGVLVRDLDALFQKFRARGLVLPDKGPVHQGPVDQTWGTREFYVDDPSGNTLRFIQRR